MKQQKPGAFEFHPFVYLTVLALLNVLIFVGIGILIGVHLS